MQTPSPQVPDEWSLVDSDYTIEGIKLGMRQPDVRRLLGAPDTTSSDSSRLVFAHIRVEFDNGSVSEIDPLDSTVGTARGLRIGADSARVLALYGPPHEGAYTYVNADASIQLALRIQKGRLQAISLLVFGLEGE